MELQYQQLIKASKKIEDLHSFIYHKFNKENFIQTPLTATFSIENRCNLNCSHCWDKGSNVNTLKVKTPTLEMVQSALNKLKNAQILHLVLTGGEIFLRKDIWNILEHIKKEKFFLTILTNGTLLNHEYIGKLLQILDPRTDIIQISLDGLEYNHNIQRGSNVFSNVIKTIKNLSDAGLRVRVHFVATPLNLKDIKATYILLNSMDIHAFSLTSVYSKNRGELLEKDFNYLEYLQSIYETKELAELQGAKTEFEYTIPVQCFKLFYYEKTHNKQNDNIIFFLKQYYSNIRINTSGDIYPGNMDHSDFLIGNIYKEEICDFYNNGAYNKISKGRNLSKSKCSECPALYVCQGGDIIRTYNKYGEMNYADPECNF